METLVGGRPTPITYCQIPCPVSLKVYATTVLRDALTEHPGSNVQ